MQRRQNNNERIIEKKKKEEKVQENIKDERGNIRIEILEKIADDAIARNPLIYKRLAEI